MSQLETGSVSLPLHFARAIEAVRELAFALEAAQRHAAILNRVFDAAVQFYLDLYFTRALSHDRTRIVAVGEILQRHINKGLATNKFSLVELAHDLDHARSLVDALAIHLAQPRVAVLTYGLVPRTADSLTALEHARSLSIHLGNARRLALRLAPYSAWQLRPADDLVNGTGRPFSIAAEGDLASLHGGPGFPLLVLVLAVQVLPASHKGRYREEFLAELLDHPSWLARMGYALRLTTQVWLLRRSLPREIKSDREAGRSRHRDTGEGEER